MSEISPDKRANFWQSLHHAVIMIAKKCALWLILLRVNSTPGGLHCVAYLPLCAGDQSILYFPGYPSSPRDWAINMQAQQSIACTRFRPGLQDLRLVCGSLY